MLETDIRGLPVVFMPVMLCGLPKVILLVPGHGASGQGLLHRSNETLLYMNTCAGELDNFEGTFFSLS